MKQQYLAPVAQGSRKRLDTFSRNVIDWSNTGMSTKDKLVVLSIRIGFVAVLVSIVLVVNSAIL